MEIELQNIKISELTAGYKDNQEAGVVGFNGKLNIRPPFQREFVYKDETLWCSPHCVPEVGQVLDLFAFC